MQASDQAPKISKAEKEKKKKRKLKGVMFEFFLFNHSSHRIIAFKKKQNQQPVVTEESNEVKRQKLLR